jgi:hypothetical protein
LSVREKTQVVLAVLAVENHWRRDLENLRYRQSNPLRLLTQPAQFDDDRVPSGSRIE